MSLPERDLQLDISRQNQQLLFTCILAAFVAAMVGYFLNRGVSVAGEKERVLALADEFARCKSQTEYLGLLQKHYPPDSRLWKAPAMAVPADEADAPAGMEILPDGRLKVVVYAMGPMQVIERRSYVYLPATLVDNLKRGYKIQDVRLNSQKSNLVFEYFFIANPSEVQALANRKFTFLFGRRSWELTPGRFR